MRALKHHFVVNAQILYHQLCMRTLERDDRMVHLRSCMLYEVQSIIVSDNRHISC